MHWMQIAAIWTRASLENFCRYRGLIIVNVGRRGGEGGGGKEGGRGGEKEGE